nr:histone acetyltransferase GCN5 isoform X2 [Tanacetum cinerariifolium]
MEPLRSSQSPSLSHSASASATLSLRKRKLTASEDHAPSNDDLESVSVRNESDDSEEFEKDVLNDDDKEEIYDDSSMRNFTVTRLESSGGVGGGRNVKAKLGNTVNVKPSEVAKDASGALVKEETMKSIFTEMLGLLRILLMFVMFQIIMTSLEIPWISRPWQNGSIQNSIT